MRLVIALCGVRDAAPAFAAGAPTFSKDVAPILFKSCVECHRPTAMAPMSLLTYEDARPWARAIKQKVATRQMPPWGADPTVGKYSNDVSLKQAEIDTIAAWVDGGAPEGEPRSAEGAAVRRRLVDRQAGLHLQDAEAVHRAGRRHGAVRLRLDPDEPESRTSGFARSS